MAKIIKTEQQWRDKLSKLEYSVTREKGTEPPFTGAYHDCKSPGIYQCACCGEDLFSSENKFDSGTGWPSYTRPMNSGAMRTVMDTSLGLKRTEVVCSSCNAHLGHLFQDGPPDAGGLRYCINSASLNLVSGGKDQTEPDKS